MSISPKEFEKLKVGSIIKRIKNHPAVKRSTFNVTQGKKYKIIKIVAGPKYAGEDYFWIINDSGKVSKFNFQVGTDRWDIVSF